MRSLLRTLIATGAILLLSPAFSLAQTTLAQGVRELAEQVVSGISKEQKRKIAVLPFRQVGGGETVLGEYLSEELITQLYQAGNLEIIERSLLDQLLGEIKLGQTGILDPETAKQVGRMAGVDAIITGTLTVLNSYVALNCRLIDTESGRIFGAAQTKIVKDADLLEILAAPLPAPTAATGPHRATAVDAAPPVQPTAEVRGFRFELQSCSRRGGDVRCTLLVTSLDSDAQLYLANAEAGRFERTAPEISTRLIDDTGSESFSTAESSLGTAAGTFPTARLASGIPITVSLHFTDVPPTATMARFLELVFSRAGSTSDNRRGTRVPGFASNALEIFTVELRDIPIEQR